MIKIGIASNGEKKITDRKRFVLWVAEDGVTKKELTKIRTIVCEALEEKGYNWELTNGFDSA